MCSLNTGLLESEANSNRQNDQYFSLMRDAHNLCIFIQPPDFEFRPVAIGLVRRFEITQDTREFRIRRLLPGSFQHFHMHIMRPLKSFALFRTSVRSKCTYCNKQMSDIVRQMRHPNAFPRLWSVEPTDLLANEIMAYTKSNHPPNLNAKCKFWAICVRSAA